MHFSQFKKKKEELFDLLIEVKIAELYPQSVANELGRL